MGPSQPAAWPLPAPLFGLDRRSSLGRRRRRGFGFAKTVHSPGAGLLGCRRWLAEAFSAEGVERVADHHQIVVAGDKLLDVAQVLNVVGHDMRVGVAEQAAERSDGAPQRDPRV